MARRDAQVELLQTLQTAAAHYPSGSAENPTPANICAQAFTAVDCTDPKTAVDTCLAHTVTYLNALFAFPGAEALTLDKQLNPVPVSLEDGWLSAVIYPNLKNIISLSSSAAVDEMLSDFEGALNALLASCAFDKKRLLIWVSLIKIMFLYGGMTLANVDDIDHDAAEDAYQVVLARFTRALLASIFPEVLVHARNAKTESLIGGQRISIVKDFLLANELADQLALKKMDAVWSDPDDPHALPSLDVCLPNRERLSFLKARHCLAGLYQLSTHFTSKVITSDFVSALKVVQQFADSAVSVATQNASLSALKDTQRRFIAAGRSSSDFDFANPFHALALCAQLSNVYVQELFTPKANGGSHTLGDVWNALQQNDLLAHIFSVLRKSTSPVVMAMLGAMSHAHATVLAGIEDPARQLAFCQFMHAVQPPSDSDITETLLTLSTMSIGSWSKSITVDFVHALTALRENASSVSESVRALPADYQAIFRLGLNINHDLLSKVFATAQMAHLYAKAFFSAKHNEGPAWVTVQKNAFALFRFLRQNSDTRTPVGRAVITYLKAHEKELLFEPAFHEGPYWIDFMVSNCQSLTRLNNLARYMMAFVGADEQKTLSILCNSTFLARYRALSGNHAATIRDYFKQEMKCSVGDVEPIHAWVLGYQWRVYPMPVCFTSGQFSQLLEHSKNVRLYECASALPLSGLKNFMSTVEGAESAKIFHHFIEDETAGKQQDALIIVFPDARTCLLLGFGIFLRAGDVVYEPIALPAADLADRAHFLLTSTGEGGDDFSVKVDPGVDVQARPINRRNSLPAHGLADPVHSSPIERRHSLSGYPGGVLTGAASTFAGGGSSVPAPAPDDGAVLV